ncbi:MAG: NADH-quinone oxidoreductase subunit J [Ilumatobacter sp.]
MSDPTALEYIVFFAATLMMLGGALGVIVFKNPVHSALGLVLTLFGVAVHYVSQEAHFLAAVQVIVYAGAIVVLFLFVIMLLGVDRAVDLSVEPIPIQRPLAAVMAVGLVGLVTAAVVKADSALGTINDGTAAEAPGINVATVENTDANIQQLAENLYTDHLLAFELTSVLLIVAVAGTVLLTRKWPKQADLEAQARAKDAAR